MPHKFVSPPLPCPSLACPAPPHHLSLCRSRAITAAGPSHPSARPPDQRSLHKPAQGLRPSRVDTQHHLKHQSSGFPRMVVLPYIRSLPVPGTTDSSHLSTLSITGKSAFAAYTASVPTTPRRPMHWEGHGCPACSALSLPGCDAQVASSYGFCWPVRTVCHRSPRPCPSSSHHPNPLPPDP